VSPLRQSPPSPGDGGRRRRNAGILARSAGTLGLDCEHEPARSIPHRTGRVAGHCRCSKVAATHPPSSPRRHDHPVGAQAPLNPGSQGQAPCARGVARVQRCSPSHAGGCRHSLPCARKARSAAFRPSAVILRKPAQRRHGKLPAPPAIPAPTGSARRQPGSHQIPSALRCGLQRPPVQML